MECAPQSSLLPPKIRWICSDPVKKTQRESTVESFHTTYPMHKTTPDYLMHVTRRSLNVWRRLVLTLNVPAEEHGSTAAQDVDTGTLLLYQGGAFGGEATVALSLWWTFDKANVVVMLHQKLSHGEYLEWFDFKLPLLEEKKALRMELGFVWENGKVYIQVWSLLSPRNV